MKKSLSIAFVYIGLVIGAGFASGREIMQYFNFPAGDHISGVVFAAFLFALVAFFILRRAMVFETYTFDSYIENLLPGFKTPMILLLLLYMFCSFFVMLSGSGSFFNEVLNLPEIFGILFMSLICFIVFIFDVKGIVAVNSVLVPFMITGILYICIRSTLFGNVPTFRLIFLNAIRDNFLFSALCYVSYNTLTAPSVLVPLTRDVSKKDIIKGAWIGGIVLGFLILIIKQANTIYFDKLWHSNIPMFKLAEISGKTAKWLYGGVLISAICTTAISQGFGILSYFKIKTFKGRIISSIILILLAIPFSLVGFGRLVKYIYGFFGIIGIIWMGYIMIKR